MPVNINIVGDDAVHALRELKKLAEGFTPIIMPVAAPANIPAPTPGSLAIAAVMAETACENSETVKGVEVTPAEEPKKATRTRKGKDTAVAPAPVTEADKAQDKADEAAEAETKAPEGLTHDDVRKAVADYIKVAGMADGIANIPNLIGAADVSALPNDQDALKSAIEALKAATSAPPAEKKVFTKDDVKVAMIAYAKKYDTDQVNMPNTMVDLPKVLMGAVGVERLGLIPDNTESYEKAVNAINAAVASNVFNRATVA